MEEYDLRYYTRALESYDSENPENRARATI